MTRFSNLLLFELKKVLARKKAILFLLALNVVPILAGCLSLIAYVRLRGMAFNASLELSVMVQWIQAVFTGHIKLFAWISPFFLALIIGDSLSGESGRGHLKTLLLTPVHRWQVIVAKAFAVMAFLLVAVTIGGMVLQVNLWIARALSTGPNVVIDVSVSTTLIETSAALRVLFLMFVGNLAMIGFMILFSMFTDSTIIMAFTSMTLLMGMQSYVLMAPMLDQFDPRYGKVSNWLFTRHLSKLFEIDTIQGLLEKNLLLTSETLKDPLLGSLGWAAFFFGLAAFIFSRKQIFN